MAASGFQYKGTNPKGSNRSRPRERRFSRIHWNVGALNAPADHRDPRSDVNLWLVRRDTQGPREQVVAWDLNAGAAASQQSPLLQLHFVQTQVMAKLVDESNVNLFPKDFGIRLGIVPDVLEEEDDLPGRSR